MLAALLASLWGWYVLLNARKMAQRVRSMPPLLRWLRGGWWSEEELFLANRFAGVCWILLWMFFFVLYTAENFGYFPLGRK